MSRIGRLNLELQEQANELGYETTQEALQDGYDVVDGKLYLTADKVLQNARDEQLGLLDEVISYLKGLDDIDNVDMLSDMVDNLRKVEKYIKEN